GGRGRRWPRPRRRRPSARSWTCCAAAARCATTTPPCSGWRWPLELADDVGLPGGGSESEELLLRRRAPEGSPDAQRPRPAAAGHRRILQRVPDHERQDALGGALLPSQHQGPPGPLQPDQQVPEIETAEADGGLRLREGRE